MEYTTISVSKVTKLRLSKYTDHQGETWDALINRILDIVNGKKVK